MKSGERGLRENVYEQHSSQGAESIALNGFGTNLALTTQSRDLIQRIAELDDLHEAGKIGEAEYQAERTGWKKQLMDSLASSERS